MIFIYRLLINLILIFSPLIVLFRLIKKKEHFTRFKEKFTYFSQKRKKGNLIWLHGASVGELMSVIPLIEKLEKKKNIKQILVTTSTLSSAKIFNKFKFKKTVHQFFPIDANIISKKFLNYWKPCMAIFIDSEIWPNTIHNLNKRKVPTILLNARITRKSFKRWRYLGNFGKKIFHSFAYAFPCNKETLNYLKFLGVVKIKLIGNLKFSQKRFKKDIAPSKLIKFLSKKVFWCASSTHKGEEEFCIEIHKRLKKLHKNIVTIIIPRHVNRKDEIIQIIKEKNLNFYCHSSNKIIPPNTDVYLVDTYGETEIFYNLNKIVFMGGSIVKHGGQNPLEPVRYGCKIIHGPNVENFKDVYKLLNKNNLSKKILLKKNFISEIEKSFKTKKSSSLIVKKIEDIGIKILKNTTKELKAFIK